MPLPLLLAASLRGLSKLGRLLYEASRMLLKWHVLVIIFIVILIYRIGGCSTSAPQYGLEILAKTVTVSDANKLFVYTMFVSDYETKGFGFDENGNVVTLGNRETAGTRIRARTWPVVVGAVRAYLRVNRIEMDTEQNIITLPQIEYEVIRDEARSFTWKEEGRIDQFRDELPKVQSLVQSRLRTRAHMLGIEELARKSAEDFIEVLFSSVNGEKPKINWAGDIPAITAESASSSFGRNEAHSPAMHEGGSALVGTVWQLSEYKLRFIDANRGEVDSEPLRQIAESTIVFTYVVKSDGGFTLWLGDQQFNGVYQGGALEIEGTHGIRLR